VSRLEAREQQVHRLWTAFEARDWQGARALFAPEATCIWWTSGERLLGAEAIVHVNAAYPEGWHIEALAVELLRDGRVLSLVRVDHGAASHYAHSWFAFDESGRIATVDEYWAEVVEPPAWRAGLVGRERFDVPGLPG